MTKMASNYTSAVATFFPKIISFTLIGMRGDTFISLFVLDQILSADFLQQKCQIVLEVDFDINRVSLKSCQAHKISLIKYAHSWLLKMSIFLAFIAHANDG